MPRPQFYLASRSPRRRDMLAQAGFVFGCLEVEVEEVPQPGESPAAYALRMAQDKARAAARKRRLDRPVLGADTDVAIDGHILGKPRDEAEALLMLRRLAGRRHEVHSAVAVLDGARWLTMQTVTVVCLAPISEADARAYWATGEPADKAGAYAIQGLGARFVREIHGSYSGVVGLPLTETVELLAHAGVAPQPRGRARRKPRRRVAARKARKR